GRARSTGPPWPSRCGCCWAANGGDGKMATGRCAAYRAGELSAVWCDATSLARVKELAKGAAPTLPSSVLTSTEDGIYWMSRIEKADCVVAYDAGTDRLHCLAGEAVFDRLRAGARVGLRGKRVLLCRWVSRDHEDPAAAEALIVLTKWARGGCPCGVAWGRAG